MRSLKQVARPPLVLLAALALTIGCEDSGVIAPSDGQMIVTANPTTVTIDELAGQTEGQSTITAQLFDANGFVLQGVGVFFTTSSGSLASSPPGQAPVAVETDANGMASDLLTLALADEETVDVTASSGTLAGSVQLTKTVSGDNRPPQAIIGVSPLIAQQVGLAVTFDGTASSDPDGQITCYKWTIESDVSADDQVYQGVYRSSVTESYLDEQQLRVNLKVSDVSNSTGWCEDCPGTTAGCGADDSYFNGYEDTVPAYEIMCDLTDPEVFAGPNQNVTLSGGQALVFLDGSASQDPDSDIVSYTWNCGNGTPTQSGPQITCTYTNSGGFTARLTVLNECGRSAYDEVQITVNAP